MKVGLVTTWAECGAGYVSLTYASALASMGIDVAIYSRGQYLRSRRWDSNFQRPWPVENDKSNAGLTRVAPGQFSRWLQQYNPDWLIFNEQRAWAPLLQAKRYGIRCAAYVDYYRSDSVQLFELYDLILCHTKRHYSVFAQDGRSYYIPWSVDLDLFAPGPRQKALETCPSPLVLLHSAGMGGPSDRKGTDLALEAFIGVEGNARLLLHTQLPRKLWPSKWHELIHADSRIEVCEGTLDAVSFYQSGDLYLYPSRLDGIGLTLPEALACGLPVITTDSPPMSEFVQDGVNGSLVSVKDFRGRSDGYYWPESWADVEHLRVCIQRYVDNPRMARSQGKIARAEMEATRHWPGLAKGIASKLYAHSIRPLSFEQRRHLQSLAQHHDRIYEPTTADHFLMGCRSLMHDFQGRLLGSVRR